MSVTIWYYEFFIVDARRMKTRRHVIALNKINLNSTRKLEEYCTISIDSSGGVTCDTAVAFWHWDHLRYDLWQTEFATDKKFIYERDSQISYL